MDAIFEAKSRKQKQMAVEEKPNPMRVWAAMSRPMVREPGAIPQPINDMRQVKMSRIFRAWYLSEAEDKMGVITAWTSERALGTHV